MDESLFAAECGQPRQPLSRPPPEMSSTLFNRGVTTQTGIRRRTEGVDKTLAELRAAVAAADETSTLARALDARVRSLEAIVTGNQAEIAALKAEIASLRAQPTVTATE